MNEKIVISINPEHVRNILDGVKKYEFRKVIARSNISTLIIYETAPVKSIVAEVEILGILTSSPDDLWEQTKKAAGISKKFFDEYFEGRETAYAYQLGRIKLYDEPKCLMDYGIKAAPQSFVYV